MREGGRQTGVSRDRLRGVLVAAEVALAITLLVGSGLLIRSAILMQRVNPGFDPKGVLTARILLPASRYATADAITQSDLRSKPQLRPRPADVERATLGEEVNAAPENRRLDAKRNADSLAGRTGEVKRPHRQMPPWRGHASP